VEKNGRFGPSLCEGAIPGTQRELQFGFGALLCIQGWFRAFLVAFGVALSPSLSGLNGNGELRKTESSIFLWRFRVQKPKVDRSSSIVKRTRLFFFRFFLVGSSSGRSKKVNAPWCSRRKHKAALLMIYRRAILNLFATT
jgi:hypothetical protein